MKRWERDLSKIHWHQENADLEPIVCPHDGSNMIGDARYGTVSLLCTQCGYRVRQVPDIIFERYYKMMVMEE